MTAALEHIDAYTIVANTDELSRAQWLDLRRQGIGGSDAAAIVGMHPYKSAFQVYLEKTEMADEDIDSEAAYWGRKLEPFVAERFCEHTGLGVERFPFLIASTARPWQQANLDRIVYPAQDTPAAPRVLEIKTVNPWDERWGHGDDIDEVPAHPAMQVLHYLDVTGFDAAYVAVLIGGQRYRQFLIERDDELIAHLRKLTAAFWQQVIDRVPPIPSALDTELLQHLYDVSPGKVVELDAHADHVAQLCRTRWSAKAEAEEALRTAEDADNQLRALLADAEIGTVGGQPVVTWKANGTFAARRFEEAEPETAAKFTTHKPCVDVDALKNDAPDIYSRYRARVLRPTKKGF